MSATIFDDLRGEVATLRELIDRSLDLGDASDDLLLQACATILASKRQRLQHLEAATWQRPQGTG